MAENLFWLRQHMRDRMMLPGSDERSGIPPHLIAHGESGALDLVHQVADVIKGIEEHATKTEAHCQGLVTRALDRLQAAEDRIKALETERQNLETSFAQAQNKIEQLESNLAQAESRVAMSEAERAAAEEQAKKADNALHLVEDAIRTKLLTATRRTFLKVGAAA